MPTGHTRSIAIDAPPDEVFAFVADPPALPRWAPAFATVVEAAGELWHVTSGEARFPVRVVADPTARTMDIVDPTDPRRGAFTRVLPNGPGSEFQFTLFFEAGTDAAIVEAQMTEVESELDAVRRHCEA